MRKKLILTFVFSLVFLTIVITIVRGAVFHSTYASLPTKAKMQSATFTWFWFYCEFSVGKHNPQSKRFSLSRIESSIYLSSGVG